MRIVAWNCNMVLDRKVDTLLSLAPDIAVIGECAHPDHLRQRSKSVWIEGEPVWIGRNPHRGLAVFAFNGYGARLAEAYHPSLRYIAPLHVEGPTPCNLLAVWAQNASAGTPRKHQLGPLRRAMTRYRSFLGDRAAVIAGDFNSNTIWDKTGWRSNHSTQVKVLEERFGLTSAYHALKGEAHGAESEPSLYWRDRTKHGPTYHIDYVFLPTTWVAKFRTLSVGTFEAWCGAGLSDHVPVIVDIDV